MTLEILGSCCVALGVVNLLLELRHGAHASDGLTKRQRRRRGVARQAVAYAEQMGGTGAEKLRHAMHHAKLMAPGYPEAAMRLEIESVLGEGLLSSTTPETLQK